jgi:acyl transferase domain-containing protein
LTEPKLSEGLSGDIAIVGMAVNLPGAPTLEAFWNNLRERCRKHFPRSTPRR